MDPGGTQVFVEDKGHASFLALFWVAVPALVAFRVLTVGETTTPEWVVVAACIVVAAGIFVGWGRTVGQEPGRIEVAADTITQWHRNGRFTRVERQPIAVRQSHVGGSPGTWYLQGQSGQVLRGAAGEPGAMGEGDIGLLGYDPFAIQAACDELGWERAGR